MKANGLFNICRLKTPSYTIDDSDKKTTAEANNPMVAGRIPDNTLCTIVLSLNLFKNFAIIITSRKEGKETPIVATTAPKIPAYFCPTYVAALTAMGPGVICDKATRFENSCDGMMSKACIS